VVGVFPSISPSRDRTGAKGLNRIDLFERCEGIVELSGVGRPKIKQPNTQYTIVSLPRQRIRGLYIISIICARSRLTTTPPRGALVASTPSIVIIRSRLLIRLVPLIWTECDLLQIHCEGVFGLVSIIPGCLLYVAHI
jgi:hypothetical protein